jgi:hypothetical protein
MSDKNGYRGEVCREVHFAMPPPAVNGDLVRSVAVLADGRSLDIEGREKVVHDGTVIPPPLRHDEPAVAGCGHAERGHSWLCDSRQCTSWQSRELRDTVHEAKTNHM